MNKETYNLTDREIILCIIFGRFKWYRKRKGGTWTLVKGFPLYWTNREPYQFELLMNEVYKIERY